MNDKPIGEMSDSEWKEWLEEEEKNRNEYEEAKIQLFEKFVGKNEGGSYCYSPFPYPPSPHIIKN